MIAALRRDMTIGTELAQTLRAALDAEMVTEHFPHYGTLDTERSPTEVNLLASLTAWTVLQNEAMFTALFA